LKSPCVFREIEGKGFYFRAGSWIHTPNTCGSCKLAGLTFAITPKQPTRSGSGDLVIPYVGPDGKYRRDGEQAFYDVGVDVSSRSWRLFLKASTGLSFAEK